MRHILKTFVLATLALIYFLGIIYTLILYIFYYVCYCKKPQLIYKQTEHNKRISKMKSLNKRFFPFILAITGILQTFIDRLRVMKKRTGSIIFEKDDGIFLVDDYQNKRPLIIRHYDFKKIRQSTLAPVKDILVNEYFKDCHVINQIRDNSDNYHNRDSVLLVHGFNSSSDSNYIVSLANHLSTDYNIFAFNSRGTQINLLTFQYYHIGYVEDVKHVLEYLLAVTKGRISIVGFSLGANWSAILMSKIRNKRITCGVGVSAPFDFIKLNEYMLTRFNIFINRVMTGNMRRFLYKHIKTFLVNKRKIIGESDYSKQRYANNYAGVQNCCSCSEIKENMDDQNTSGNFYTRMLIGIIKCCKIKYKNNQLEMTTIAKNICKNDHDDNSEFTSITVKDIDECRLLQDIDRNITTRIFKFDSLNEFYKNGSCVNYLDQIKCPFLIINACDDPVVPKITIDIEKVLNSDHVFLVLSMKGGHLGFMGYNWEKSYVEEIIIDFLKMHN